MPYGPYYGKYGIPGPIWPITFVAGPFFLLCAAVTASYAATASWRPGPYQLLAFGLAGAFSVMGATLIAYGIWRTRNFLRQRRTKDVTIPPRGGVGKS